MRKKIIVILILGMFLFASITIFPVQSKSIAEENTSINKEIAKSSQELCPLDYNPIDESGNIINVNYSRDNINNSLINTNNLGNHVLVLEPPWAYDSSEKKDKWGVSDSWAESTEINGEYGSTSLHAWAGPGAGEASISKNLMHYNGFRPPKDESYSFQYKFKQQGEIKLDSMFDLLGSSAARGGVTFYFYLWDGETISFEQSMTVKDCSAIGGAGNGEYPYNIVKTYSNSAHLQKDVSYTFGANGVPWIVVDGFVIAYGSADQSVDWAGLQSVEIQWPNSPPNTPKVVDPSDGATGVSISPTLRWSCSDPDGKYDPLKYDIYFGETSSPPLKSSDQSSTSYKPGKLKKETTYYWKIVVKDSKGETKAGQTWKFSTEKEDKSRDANQKNHIPELILNFKNYFPVLIVQKLSELFNKKLSNLSKE